VNIIFFKNIIKYKNTIFLLLLLTTMHTWLDGRGLIAILFAIDEGLGELLLLDADMDMESEVVAFISISST